MTNVINEMYDKYCAAHPYGSIAQQTNVYVARTGAVLRELPQDDSERLTGIIERLANVPESTTPEDLDEFIPRKWKQVVEMISESFTDSINENIINSMDNHVDAWLWIFEHSDTVDNSRFLNHIDYFINLIENGFTDDLLEIGAYYDSMKEPDEEFVPLLDGKPVSESDESIETNDNTVIQDDGTCFVPIETNDESDENYPSEDSNENKNQVQDGTMNHDKNSAWDDSFPLAVIAFESADDAIAYKAIKDILESDDKFAISCIHNSGTRSKPMIAQQDYIHKYGSQAKAIISLGRWIHDHNNMSINPEPSDEKRAVKYITMLIRNYRETMNMPDGDSMAVIRLMDYMRYDYPTDGMNSLVFRFIHAWDELDADYREALSIDFGMNMLSDTLHAVFNICILTDDTDEIHGALIRIIDEQEEILGQE